VAGHSELHQKCPPFAGEPEGQASVAGAGLTQFGFPLVAVLALSETWSLTCLLSRKRVANVQLICSWYFCSWNLTNSEVPDQAKFFTRLGARIRRLRKAQGFSQEDMISFGFSARHWQQIEAGRPITVTTLLRICEVFRVPAARLLQGLDKGIY